MPPPFTSYTQAAVLVKAADHPISCAIDGTSRETVYWSDEMFRLFGFDPQQDPPMFDQWLQRIHPEDREKLKLANEKTFHRFRRTRNRTNSPRLIGSTL